MKACGLRKGARCGRLRLRMPPCSVRHATDWADAGPWPWKRERCNIRPSHGTMYAYMRSIPMGPLPNDTINV